MKNLAAIFPRASKSFIDANPQSSHTKTPKNDVQPVLKRKRGKMNKTEASFALVLDALKRNGEIERYDFQGITLRWPSGDDVIRYTADFAVFPIVPKCSHFGDSKIRLVEVKGGYSKMPGFLERAVERFRHARTYWPQFGFELHKKTKDGWKQIH